MYPVRGANELAPKTAVVFSSSSHRGLHLANHKTATTMFTLSVRRSRYELRHPTQAQAQDHDA
jgi:hypothetical protein